MGDPVQLRRLASRGEWDAPGRDAVELTLPAAVTRSPRRRVPPLNDRDAVILEGVASGASSVQLAASLFLSQQGVSYHIGRLLRRFRVPNRTALVGRAYSLGIFDSGSWPPRVLREFVADE
ncbi:LuxR C-terminal-related transcriptional regulator [Plantactinospora sp. ZYX-F-223]|uniref:LuxR C-terminal-related transcriptional regulator n=1 Tax=Plantactinospora sp. ZYX-F-223 TaxID=3144103 RepID=UPI0031FC3E9E